MKETHITKEQRIYIDAINKRCNKMEFDKDSERDLLLDFAIEKELNRKLAIKKTQNIFMQGSKICEAIRESDTQGKGKRLEVTGKLVSFVYDELKKGRNETDLLTELLKTE